MFAAYEGPLNGVIVALVIGIIICCCIFFYNSREGVYLAFSVYAFFGHIVPTLRIALFTSNQHDPLENFTRLQRTANGVAWWLLVYLLFDTKNKILSRTWLTAVCGFMIYSMWSTIAPSPPLYYADWLTLDISVVLFNVVALGILIGCCITAPPRFPYYLLSYFFITFTALSLIMTIELPGIQRTLFVRPFRLLTLPIGFCALLIRYRSFLHDVEKGLPRLHRPNRKVAEQILRSQEQERERIARDLHDQLGSTLATIKMQLQSWLTESYQAAQAITLLDKASADVRNIAQNLMPVDFAETNLHTILQSLFYRLNNEGVIQFTLYHTEQPARLAKQYELVVFRIILELVTNIVKHSGARDASVQLVYYERALKLLVEDSGKGFNTTNQKGLGLKNIRSRVKYLKGSMHIDSSHKGTTTVIHLPYE